MPCLHYGHRYYLSRYQASATKMSEVWRSSAPMLQPSGDCILWQRSKRVLFDDVKYIQKVTVVKK